MNTIMEVHTHMIVDFLFPKQGSPVGARKGFYGLNGLAIIPS